MASPRRRQQQWGLPETGSPRGKQARPTSSRAPRPRLLLMSLRVREAWTPGRIRLRTGSAPLCTRASSTGRARRSWSWAPSTLGRRTGSSRACQTWPPPASAPVASSSTSAPPRRAATRASASTCSCASRPRMTATSTCDAPSSATWTRASPRSWACSWAARWTTGVGQRDSKSSSTSMRPSLAAPRPYPRTSTWDSTSTAR
mmetsp:Transcript_24186/g.65514  ORF Transcript_24186/g.65514 Transcript_24186/m.65514 type:complete len:202 (-) Transcript_24186:2101-2706(-)